MAPIPTLAYFCCWNRSVATGQRDEHDEEDAGTLYFGTKLPELNAFRRARKVGLAQGLVDFTRMLSTSTETLKAVHSSQQRMLFYEPEEGFVLHAAIDLARLPNKDKAHIRNGSQSSAGSNLASTSANDEGLEDEALLAGVKDIYDRFKLLHGSFEHVLAQEGRKGLSDKLAAFLDEAIWLWQLEKAVLGMCDFAEVLGALPAASAFSVIASLPNLRTFEDHAILLDHDEVLHVPPDPAYKPIARHLLAKQPHRPRSEPDELRSSKTPTPAPSTASKWTLGLSDYLSAGSKAEKEREALRSSHSSSRSWLRVVSWSSRGGKDMDEKAEVKAEAEPTAADDSDDSSIAEHIARQAANSSSDSLAEAAEEEQKDTVEEPALESVPTLFEPPLRVFMGERWVNVHVLRRDHLTLGVVQDAVPDDKAAAALLSAVEDAIESHNTPAPSSTYRHLLHDRTHRLQRSSDWPSSEETWSGKRSSKEADVVGALVDFASDSRYEEALIRTGSGQWAAARRAPTLATSASVPDVYLVLPRRFGQHSAEGSLLDAAHELNARLGRASM